MVRNRREQQFDEKKKHRSTPKAAHGYVEVG